MPELVPVLARTHGVMLFSDRFDELVQTCCASQVPWNSFNIPDAETGATIGLIREFEQAYRSGRASSLLCGELATALHNVVLRLAGSRHVVSVLHLIDNVIHENLNLAYLLYKSSGENMKVALDPFYQVLQGTEIASQHHNNNAAPASSYAELAKMLACRIIVGVAMFSNVPLEAENFLPLFDFIQTQTSGQGDAAIMDFYFQLLHPIMCVPALRIAAYEYNKGSLPSLVVRFLSLNVSPQWQYNALMVMWQWTFYPDARDSMQSLFNLIPKIVDIVKCSVSEKVLRLAWQLLESLSNAAAGFDNANIMIACHLNEHIEERQRTNTMPQDTAICEQMTNVQARLEKALCKLSTLDQYIGELMSGKLQWTPAHNSESFWERYAERICKDNSGSAINLLAEHLVTLTDVTALCVAAHDVGQIIRYYPDGRRLLTALGVKQRMMALTDHHDDEVKYHALVACHMFMTMRSYEPGQDTLNLIPHTSIHAASSAAVATSSLN